MRTKEQILFSTSNKHIMYMLQYIFGTLNRVLTEKRTTMMTKEKVLFVPVVNRSGLNQITEAIIPSLLWGGYY